jgi:hypothetical protein
MSNPPPTLAYATPFVGENTWSDIARRALLWTLLCSISAIPSFLWSRIGYNDAAIVCGVCLFIILYTVFTSTPQFLRFREKPFVRRTLYIGYATRILVSVIFPVGMALDLIPGLISIGLVESGGRSIGPSAGITESFIKTLLITIIQGTILNIILSVYMLILWVFQRLFCKPPVLQRGFPVEINAAEASVSVVQAPDGSTGLQRPPE